MNDDPNLAVGSRAPNFSLPATNGAQISLEDYLAHKNVYLFFVREFN